MWLKMLWCNSELSIVNNTEKSFTVVMRGPSAIVFSQNESLTMDLKDSPLGPLTATYATRWLKKDDEVVVPGQLCIEIKGTGNSLEEVLIKYANSALIPIPLLALATNAAVEDLEIELGFETTLDVAEREYFQSYVPQESGIVYLGRHINIATTVDLINAVNNNPNQERLMRATSQYLLALSSWKLGKESMSLAHLWMALEALTKAVISSEFVKRDCKTQADLADLLGVELKQLDATIRKKFILKDDEDCYKKAKEASDGLEHGFLGYDKIRDSAKDVRHRMAGYIRVAIIELSGASEQSIATLMAEPFDKPMGRWPIAKYLRGHLLGGNSESLALKGNAYPFMRWNPIIQSCAPSKDGKLNFQFTENMTAELGDGVSFRPQSFEAWQPD